MFTVKTITHDNTMTLYEADKVRVVRGQPDAVELYEDRGDDWFARFEVGDDQPWAAVIVENEAGKTTEVVRA